MISDELDKSIRKFKEEKHYKKARNLIVKNLNNNLVCEYKYKRQLAELTYQDKELSFGYAINEAMKILNSLNPKTDDDYQETWCLKGAIKKR